MSYHSEVQIERFSEDTSHGYLNLQAMQPIAQPYIPVYKWNKSHQSFKQVKRKMAIYEEKHSYHFLQISGAFRRVPSPLQGTSHKTRSKRSCLMLDSNSVPIPEALESFLFKRQPGKCWASWFVTIRLAVHILFVWWMRRLHLWTSRSFATT